MISCAPTTSRADHYCFFRRYWVSESEEHHYCNVCTTCMSMRRSNLPHSDALAFGAQLSAINSWNKGQILSCLSNMDEGVLKCLLLAMFTPNAALGQNKLIDLKDVVSCRDHLIRHCAVFQDANKCPVHRGQRNAFTSLPLMIGGYIMSFCTMKDRINHELVSKDFYKFAQSPNAKYHVAIDRKFAKAVCNGSIKLEKHYSAGFLDVSFMIGLNNLYRGEDLEHQYYAAVSQIVAKSPSMHTLKYALTEDSARSSFKSPSSCANRGPSNILHFIKMVQLHSQSNSVYKFENENKFLDESFSQSRANVFRSVKELIYKPSKYSERVCRRSGTEKPLELLRSFLPNILRYTLYEEPHAQSRNGSRNRKEIDLILESSWPSLQYLECDLVANRLTHAYPREWFRQLHPRHAPGTLLLSPIKHPLAHFHRFMHLNVLKLRLLLWPAGPRTAGCQNYYERIITAASSPSTAVRSHSLTELSVEFDRQSQRSPYGSTINSVCSFLLQCSPNISSYTLLTNGADDEYEHMDHLMGRYDQLQSLETDCDGLVMHRDIRMLSLKRLIFRTRDWRHFSIEESFPTLEWFPNLEVFKIKVICGDNFGIVRHNSSTINGNAETFVAYVMKQKHNNKLKHLGISHLVEHKQHKSQLSSFRNSKLNSVALVESEELLKALVSLTSLPYFKLQSIELKPVVFSQKEMEYLNFWFYGWTAISNEDQRHSRIAMDLVCSLFYKH